MLTRSHFSVDVWFIFGSFCYGAEASIVACNQDHLRIKLTATSAAALNELTAFFESINEKAKALVRTEARIFVNNHPNAPAQDWADELLATMMTDLKPRLMTVEDSGEGPSLLLIELLDLRGLTPNDQTTWSNLVADVWPQLPA